MSAKKDCIRRDAIATARAKGEEWRGPAEAGSMGREDERESIPIGLQRVIGR